MTTWDYEIDLREEFELYLDHEDYDVFKSAVIPKLRAFLNEHEEEEFAGELEDLINELENCDDAEEWDGTWDCFYDTCDAYSIWVRSIA